MSAREFSSHVVISLSPSVLRCQLDKLSAFLIITQSSAHQLFIIMNMPAMTMIRFSPVTITGDTLLTQVEIRV